MRRHRLTICVLLLSLVPAAVLAQSLGEVAREQREKRAEQPKPHLKVYTNDDLQTPTERAAGGQEQENASAETGEADKKDSAGKDAKKKPTPEEEMQKQTDEVNKKYLDRIAKIKDKIKETQQDISKLERDRLATTYQFRTSNGISPSIYEYQEEMKGYEQQIDADKKQIESLNAEMEDAQEQARHAGVPHVYE